MPDAYGPPMTSSSPETSTRTTGAHRAHREARDRAAARTVAQHPSTRYEPYLDGLFTYCLSVLCDHDAATAALADVLVLAERRGQRVPGSPADRRPWLYALARWACLRKLAEAKQKRQGSHAAGRHGAHRGTGPEPGPAVPEDVQEQRRRELALLAWPEAAGTTPEQREALELAVRHHLAAHEVAAVLGLGLAAARELLASAACEVERTRAALAVVETGTCPGVARLTGDRQLVLGTALRRELVRHVDDCPRCRRTAERAVPGRWPGAAVTPAELPVLPAPRAALHMALAHAPARGAAPCPASTGAASRWTRRTAPPAGTGCARVPSPRPSSPPSSPPRSSRCGRPTGPPRPASPSTGTRPPRARRTAPARSTARARTAATRTPQREPPARGPLRRP